MLHNSTQTNGYFSQVCIQRNDATTIAGLTLHDPTWEKSVTRWMTWWTLFPKRPWLQKQTCPLGDDQRLVVCKTWMMLHKHTHKNHTICFLLNLGYLEQYTWVNTDATTASVFSTIPETPPQHFTMLFHLGTTVHDRQQRSMKRFLIWLRQVSESPAGKTIAHLVPGWIETWLLVHT